MTLTLFGIWKYANISYRPTEPKFAVVVPKVSSKHFFTVDLAIPTYYEARIETNYDLLTYLRLTISALVGKVQLNIHQLLCKLNVYMLVY